MPSSAAARPQSELHFTFYLRFMSRIAFRHQHLECFVPNRSMSCGPSRNFVSFPEVDPSAFDDFSLWVHSEGPEIRKDVDCAGVVESGILAEMYIVERLCNQASDLLQS
jgi:hypothetical protein